MKISARNIFAGTITDIKLGTTTAHVTIDIGGSTIMLGEARDGMHRPGFVYVHVEDCDAVYAKALRRRSTTTLNYINYLQRNEPHYKNANFNR